MKRAKYRRHGGHGRNQEIPETRGRGQNAEKITPKHDKSVEKLPVKKKRKNTPEESTLNWRLRVRNNSADAVGPTPEGFHLQSTCRPSDQLPPYGPCCSLACMGWKAHLTTVWPKLLFFWNREPRACGHAPPATRSQRRYGAYHTADRPAFHAHHFLFLSFALTSPACDDFYRAWTHRFCHVDSRAGNWQ